MRLFCALSLSFPFGDREAQFKPRGFKGRGHQIGTIEDIELSKGDKIRTTGLTMKNAEIVSNMRGQVVDVRRSFDGSAVATVRLDNGKTFEIGNKGRVELTYSYASTGHAFQGLSAERPILDFPTDTKMTNERAVYTNLTRVTKGAALFTDNAERLLSVAGRKNDKTLSHDVLGGVPKGKTKSVGIGIQTGGGSNGMSIGR